MLLYNWVVFGGISELFWALGQGLLVDRRLNCLKVRNSCLGTSSRAGHWTRFGFQCTARRRQSWRGIIPAASAQKLIQFCVLPHFFYNCGHARYSKEIGHQSILAFTARCSSTRVIRLRSGEPLTCRVRVRSLSFLGLPKSSYWYWCAKARFA